MLIQSNLLILKLAPLAAFAVLTVSRYKIVYRVAIRGAILDV